LLAANGLLTLWILGLTVVKHPGFGWWVIGQGVVLLGWLIVEVARMNFWQDIEGSSEREKARSERPVIRLYRSSSIHFSSTSLPGRTTDSGSVASGCSVTFSMSMKLGACALM